MTPPAPASATRLVLVRHGQAAAGWDRDLDPGLSPLGHEQAARNAAALAAELERRPVVSSPLRRARETAAPLARRWGGEISIEPAVGEIASPTNDLEARSAWLASVMSARWGEVDGPLRVWRQEVLDTLTGLAADTVVFTHYIAINVAVGVATGDDRVVCCSPDNASRTVIEVAGGRLRLVSLGEQVAGAVSVGQGLRP